MIGVAIQGAGNVSTEHIKAYENNPPYPSRSHWQSDDGKREKKGHCLRYRL